MNREALFKISYGLYVISSVDSGNYSGFIGNTVFQITSKPVQIALGVSRDNYTHKFIVNSGVFTASVLNQDVNIDLIQTLPAYFMRRLEILEYEIY